MTDELPGAGPELDKLVAESLGHSGHGKASQSMAGSMNSLRDWRNKNPTWTGRISLPRGRGANGREYRAQLWREGDYHETVVMGCSPTLAVAICRAIVLAGRAMQG